MTAMMMMMEAATHEEEGLRISRVSSPIDSKTISNLRQSIVSMSSKLSSVAASSPLRRSTLALHRTLHSGSKVGVPQPALDCFEEVRHMAKQGGEFSKELVAALQERADLELTYAKGLAKVSSKIAKACQSVPVATTVTNSWHFIGEDMEGTAETHKSIAHHLLEELVKPLRSFVDAQHKTRKAMEAIVERRAKAAAEWRASETKARGKCYTSCKENERVQDAVLDTKLGRGRVPSEKEMLKLDTKRKKSEEAVKKTDLDYYACCLKAERARLEWESGLVRGSSMFRQLERDRLGQLHSLAMHYYSAMKMHRPRLVAAAQRLAEPVNSCNVETDMDAVDRKVSPLESDTLGGPALLPCFYAEDASQAMNMERRRQALAQVLRLITADIEREKKGRAGVANLAKALAETPKFGSQESQQEVQEKLGHMAAMVTFLEACRYKVLNALLDLEGRPRISHPLGSYIEPVNDKTGTSVLRIPYWTRQETFAPIDYDWEGQHRNQSPPHGGLPQINCGWSSSSSSSSCISLSKRGRADGGLFPLERKSSACHAPQPEMVAEIPFGARGTADGGEPNEPDDDSDFDDFSDDDGTVNIIEVVNGRPSSRPVSPIIAQMQVGDKEPHMAQDMEDNLSQEPVAEDEELNVTAASTTSSPPPAMDSGIGSHQHPAVSQEKEIDEIYYTEDNKMSVSAVPSLGKCTVLYDYAAKMYDELSIRVGDVINIHDKQEDGWWLGELQGTVGIFPATYVEELK